MKIKRIKDKSVLIKKKLPNVIIFFLLLCSVCTISGCLETTTEIVNIMELKGPDWQDYIDKEVTVEGIFVKDPLPMLVTTLDIMKTNLELPDEHFIRLSGVPIQEITPEKYGGRELRVKGVIKVIGNDNDTHVNLTKSLMGLDVVSFESIRLVDEYNPEIQSIEIHPDSHFSQADRYAILFSGGGKHTSNHVRYWNDLKFMYSTLVNEYKYSEDLIVVLYADGTGRDSQIPVHYAATQTNLETVFGLLRESSTTEDQIFFYTTDHGGGFCKNGIISMGKVYYICGGRHDSDGDEGITDTISESAYNLDLNDDGLISGSVSWDEELRSWGGHIIDDSFDGMLANLNYNKMIIVMEQCFSGGLIADMARSGNNRIIMSAAGEYEPSEAMPPDYNYNEFVYYFTCAVNRETPAGLSVNADYDGDGDISMVEAFNYARNHNTRSETPWYEDSGDGVPHSGEMPSQGEGLLGSDTTL